MATGSNNLRQDTVQTAQGDTVDEQVVVLNLGEELFGIDIARVQEIIRWRRVTAIPKAPGCVEGIINLRGRTVPVVDLRSSFGLAAALRDKETRIVVVEIRGFTVGLVVDSVSEVLHVPGSAVEPPSQVVTTTDSGFLRGIARLDERLILLLDLEEVLSADPVVAAATAA